MAKKRNIADSIREDIEIAKNKVTDAQEKFDLWSGRLTSAQQEVDRLESALAAMEGVPAPPRRSREDRLADFKMPLIPATDAAGIAAGRDRRFTEHEELAPAAAPVATKPNRIMFNGVEIELEPGFKVRKNSFGEDCLVPEGMPDLLPMEEPTQVRKPDFSLPAVGSSDGFTRPEDLF